MTCIQMLQQIDSMLGDRHWAGPMQFCWCVHFFLILHGLSSSQLRSGPYARASPLSWITRLRIVVDAAQETSKVAIFY
ncbi:hypothetical protein GOP47_0002936 [Adiantum capillus-veneris]|uniref:Uncharacterized protein n=1 Tax=Adiantum capillus-veneris TaxID=13818 RepID=A0A9D4VCR1_ADICA|nr:hypothetical protein GOP47_0002936 [Adiantum capillus-veneris]